MNHSNETGRESSAEPTSPARTRRATIEDVASAASVSVATVSRALRGLPNVADSTRQRVRDVASDLAYRPDPAAARLAAGRTSTVTIAVPSLNGWYFSTVVAGAEAVCADAGLEFQVIGVSSPSDRQRLFDEACGLERRTDGLILVDIALDERDVESIERRNIGLATVGTCVPGHPAVLIDDEHVGRIAADHLVGLGHERIALIGGRYSEPMGFAVPPARRRGFASALVEHGLELDEANTMGGDFTLTSGHQAMTTLLQRTDRITAVFAMSDEMAFGALMAMNEHDLQPGVDVSIIGVDDHEFSRVVELTTVGQPVADHGARAANMLVESMRHADRRRAGDAGDPPDDRPFEPHLELVVRSTTGPPR